MLMPNEISLNCRKKKRAAKVYQAETTTTEEILRTLKMDTAVKMTLSLDSIAAISRLKCRTRSTTFKVFPRATLKKTRTGEAK